MFASGCCPNGERQECAAYPLPGRLTEARLQGSASKQHYPLRRYVTALGASGASRHLLTCKATSKVAEGRMTGG